MLHITDGESVAGTLRESGIPGVVSTYGDMMYEGPAPAGLDAKQWREARARFMAEADFATLDEARAYLQACEDTLAAYRQHEEVVIWLDHRLSNQLILIKVLDWFSQQDSGQAKLSLLCVGHYEGVEHFVGLGALEAKHLRALADRRIPVTDAHYRTAQAAWRAFTSDDPRDIERFVESDTNALPFLAAALRRHLEQFPSLENGLSRTEQQALILLRDKGTLTGAQLFVAVQHMEEAVFMGDASFYNVVSGLSRGPHPLVRISDTPNDPPGNVTITETGLKVLDGKGDRVQLNGIHRWLGGVYLDDKTPWRWDRSTNRIVSRSS